MSITMAPERPAEKWIPPLDADGLKLVLERVRNWNPLDVEAVFDDLDTAIGNQPPPVATIPALVDQLRGHLKQLSDIILADEGYPPTPDMVRLVARGLSLRDEFMPLEYQHAVGFARRLAFTTADLNEELINARYIKAAE
ncbi:DUF6415 family natural product biosynthesis protein [Streptomyces sp. NPDC079020]|uniref:DUF6415 family natural product biosynthesis protein n=1 Tax=Streptomyces sp. NPDC079020 TaxID=3365722 RepID=UPI0037CD11C3